MTTAGRDRTIDAVRAYAVTGVVLGHWLVTGLAFDDDGLRQTSPLSAMPHLAPATWLLQTLGLFFFVGGYAATRSAARHRGHRTRLTRMLRRLARPVAALLAVWAAALTVAACLGTPTGTLTTVATLVVSPLWFLAPYVLLAAATGPLLALLERGAEQPVAGRRAGVLGVLAAVAFVGAADAGLVPGPPAVVTVLQVPVAWSVPWVLGVAAARGSLTGRRAGAALLALGVISVAVLVLIAGYPASAVGVPGAGRSNLSPPSLLALALAAAQVGTVLLLRARPARPAESGRRHRLLVTAVNRRALPVYLCHQSVLVALILAVSPAAPAMPGLLTPAVNLSWVLHRVAWLPVLVLLLWWCCLRAGRTATPRGAPPALDSPAAAG